MADLIDRDAAYDAIGFERCDGSCTDCPTKCTWFYTVKNIPSVNRCIPCSERMPEIRTPVLIYDKHHKAFFVAKLDEDYFGFSSNMWHHPADVPFWMPLPETPKEDDND